MTYLISGIPFVLIPAGSSWLGVESGGYEDLPVQRVVFETPFLLSATMVTRRQWRSVFGWDGEPESADLPQFDRSFADVVGFASRVSGTEGRVYIPSELEWEHAATCGGTWEPDDFDSYYWSKRTSGGHAHPVAQLKPNPWGLYDMLGNGYQWCSERFDVDPAVTNERVLRGSTWNGTHEGGVRPTMRNGAGEERGHHYVGVRLAAQIA